MKNKYLNKFFCITMLSAMVLAIPTGVKAAEEADNVVAEEGVSGDGSAGADSDTCTNGNTGTDSDTCTNGNAGANRNTCTDGNTGQG